MMVLSLCAIVSTVQLENSVRMVAWIRSSVSRSTAAVASSNTRILDLRSNARAKHTSWRWPTLNTNAPSNSELFAPVSATFVWTRRFTRCYHLPSLFTVSLWAQNLPFHNVLSSTLVCFCLSDWSRGSRPFTGLICSSVLCFKSRYFCFSYSYVWQTKLASSLVNFWAHNNILLLLLL